MLNSLQATDGWFSSQAIDRIKIVLRHKFFSLLEGHIATDQECEDLLITEPGTKLTAHRGPNLRLGKHNMAKGAIPLEDLAVRDRLISLTCSFIEIIRRLLGCRRRCRETRQRDAECTCFNKFILQVPSV